MDCADKFNNTELPKYEDFYSKVSGKNISKKEYQHAQHIWNHFNIKTMGEYHDLYLQLDVLLLADVMTKFRQTCMEHYKLDPVHFYTLPNFSWNAMLKMTDVSIELMQDIDMYNMISKNIRGGLCTTGSIRHATANNPYMNELYNPDEETSFILATDANNLYGKAMTEPLPYGNFEWFNPSHITMDFIKDYDVESEDCYILEVDLEYPTELHDKHNDYPLAPQVMNVKADSLSAYQIELY